MCTFAGNNAVYNTMNKLIKPLLWLLPEMWKLLDTSLVTTDYIRVAPKKYYSRMRPYIEMLMK